MRAELSRIDTEDVLELRLESDHGGTGAGLALRKTGDEGTAIHVGLEWEGSRARAPLAGLPIADGVWEVLWVDGEGRSVPLSTRDAGFSVAERISYLRGRRERELRALRDQDGRLRVHSAAVSPYAEVGWVEVGTDAGTVTVSGVLAYESEPEHGGTAAEIVARQRGLDGLLTAPAEIDGARFRCVVPLAPVAEAHVFERKHNEWDLWLRTHDERPELRLAMHADDIVDKKRKIVYPTAVVDTGAGNEGAAQVRVRPYYTAKDELSLLALEHDGGAR
ncbi:hypothetical protein DFP74_0256 [Nocardiopsis sp. Huas11]|uniref:hypothetical protein n=1 Tax=Nocardiopsis sp. Huas11 TaxID=2183912 RepID=UPI000EAC2040|nr:hypothetical protein [Nocardiopsis sp. Huas11]RKS04688.1 hypothetical protein DFP74_0256 [Nocardiopsis sp. Huas11]